jgi:hypothetical protein
VSRFSPHHPRRLKFGIVNLDRKLRCDFSRLFEILFGVASQQVNARVDLIGNYINSTIQTTDKTHTADTRIVALPTYYAVAIVIDIVINIAIATEEVEHQLLLHEPYQHCLRL